MTEIVSPDKVSIEKILKSSQASLQAPTSTEEQIAAIYFPRNPNQTARVKVLQPKTKQGHVLFVQPETGRILAREDGEQLDVLEWIYRIHRGTWAGYPSRVLASTLAILTVFLWPLGWIVRKNRTKRKKQAVWVKKNFTSWAGSHRTFGYFTGGFLIFMAFSGALMNFNSDLINLFDPIHSPTDSLAQPSSSVPLVQQLETAQKLRPSSKLDSIHLAKAPPSTILFYFQDNSRVYLEKGTLNVIKVMSPTSHWIHALYPIHSGRLLGAGKLPFILLIGTTSLAIILSGTLSTQTCKKWLKRKPR
jgi:uncharacterized iron-regulated membrane protein